MLCDRDHHNIGVFIANDICDPKIFPVYDRKTVQALVEKMMFMEGAAFHG